MPRPETEITEAQVRAEIERMKREHPESYARWTERVDRMTERLGYPRPKRERPDAD